MLGIFIDTHTETHTHGKVLFVSWKRVPVLTFLPDFPGRVILKQGKICPFLPGIHLRHEEGSLENRSEPFSPLWKITGISPCPQGKLFPARLTAQLTTPAPLLPP